MTASGTICVSSYCNRWREKLSAARLSFGFPPPPNQLTPKPGRISETVASSAQNVGTHLPYRSDTIAVTMVNQMKATAYTYFPAPPTGPKTSSTAANDTIVSDPPIQIGLEIQ